MRQIGAVDIAGFAASPSLKPGTGEGEANEGIKALDGHGRQGGGSGLIPFQLGGDATNPTKTTGPVAREFEGWDLGLARTSHADADDLAATVEIGGDGFP